jgi:hypothetical protein
MVTENDAPQLRKNATSGSNRELDHQARNVESEPSDTRKGIFVRLGPVAKRILEDEASKGKTYTEIIEKILEYFGVQSAKLKDEILKGEGINLLTKFEDLLALTQRAQHAFENKRFYFAAKTYMAIDDYLKESYSSKELKDVCNYRRAHCWMQLSYELRVEALKTKKLVSYESASRALKQALVCLGRLSDDGEPLIDLIKHYNMACCYSLQAQYEVECNLGSETLGDLCDAAKSPVTREEHTRSKWKAIGEDWRKTSQDGASAAKVDQLAKRAHDELEIINPPPSKSPRASGDSTLMYERIWIVETATKDSDLIFLQSDKETWQPQFDQWAANIPQNEMPPLARAIEDLFVQEELLRHD